ncbi:MAG: amidohydrolase family protein [Candidatus Dormibacteraeota bacterium]|nr:amidohydrolase family protein [Candidatus Dormibacteraeota bacterium]
MIDAHHHLWDPSQAHYPWLEREQAAPVRRRFDIADLRAVTAGHDVEGTVVIEARHSLDETRSLMAVAASGDLVSAVVGWVDLTDPGLEDVLAGLRSEPGGDRLAGIRVELDAHEPEWLARPEVKRGLRTLAAAGLTYDVLADASQLGAAVSAARSVPELTVVVDHLGKPNVASGEDPAWAASMAALGALPNVWCKVSGGSAARIMSRSPDAIRRVVAGVREWFGDGRLVFGSDWPVCTLSAPYSEVLRGWQELLADLAPADREATFGGNARRTYRLH